MTWLSDTILHLAGPLVLVVVFALLGFAASPAWRTAEGVAGRAGLVLLGTIVVVAAAAALLRWRRSGDRGRPAPERPGRH
jgi:membrane protein DedA with SNARE-associated domain